MACKHWREYDDDNGDFEYCKGAQKKCTCAGVHYQCDFPMYFNIPIHRIKLQRRLDNAQRTVAMVEPYTTRR